MIPVQAPLSFVACVSDDDLLDANLLASPCLQPNSPHEVILVRNCGNAVDGLNVGFERARSPWIVCLHQDVYLPDGWDQRLMRQLESAARQFGPIGVAGVYGVGSPRETRGESHGAGKDERQSAPDSPRFTVQRFGRVVHRGHKLFDGRELPARVDTLDELLLVVPRDTPLRFDPALGFHLYGADICLQAEERGLPVVVLDAVCHHNTRNVSLPKPFFRSAQIFALKWSHRLPVATSCVVIDERQRVWVLGSARRDHRSGGREQFSPQRAQSSQRPS